MYKSSKFIVYLSFLFITIHSCLASKAGIQIAKDADSIHDKRTAGQPVNEDTVKNIYTLVTNNIDTKNKISDQDLERAIYAIHESVTVRGKDCFKFIIDYSHSDENAYNTHMHYLNVLTFGSYIMHKNRTSCLWSADYFNKELSARYVKYLGKTNISQSRQKKLKDRFNIGLSEKYFTLFRAKFMHSHKDMPDVDHQYLLKTADAIRENKWDSYKQDTDYGFKYYGIRNAQGNLDYLCVQKPKKENYTRQIYRQVRLWENEVLSTKLARTAGLQDVMAEVDEYGDYTYEPFVSVLGKYPKYTDKDAEGVDEFLNHIETVKALYKSNELMSRVASYDQWSFNSSWRYDLGNLKGGNLKNTAAQATYCEKFLENAETYEKKGQITSVENQSIVNYYLGNFDISNFTKVMTLNYLIGHFDLHSGNIMLSVDENGKLIFTLIDFEYALDPEWVRKKIIQSGGNQNWLWKYNRLPNIMYQWFMMPEMNDLIQRVDSSKLIRQFSKKCRDQNAINNFSQRIDNLKEADWIYKSISDIFCPLFERNIYEKTLISEYFNLMKPSLEGYRATYNLYYEAYYNEVNRQLNILNLNNATAHHTTSNVKKKISNENKINMNKLKDRNEPIATTRSNINTEKRIQFNLVDIDETIKEFSKEFRQQMEYLRQDSKRKIKEAQEKFKSEPNYWQQFKLQMQSSPGNYNKKNEELINFYELSNISSIELAKKRFK